MIAFGQEHNYGKVPADKILFYKSSNMRDLKNYRIKVTPISSSLTEKIYVHLVVVMCSQLDLRLQNSMYIGLKFGFF